MKRFQQAVLVLLTLAAASPGISGPVARLLITPGQFSARPGMAQKFQATGLDAFDNIVTLTEPVTWSTTAGTITPDGLFTATTTTGRYPLGVKATVPSGAFGAAIVNIEAPAATAGYVWERTWGAVMAGQLVSLSDLAVASDNSILVADRDNHCVQRFDSNGNFIGILGPPSFAPFDPVAMAVQGNTVYVADDYFITKWNLSGNYIMRWGSYPTFYVVRSIALDMQGNLYVLDGPNTERIQKYTTTGVLVTSWGSSGSGDGQLNSASDVCTDGDGNVYVADSGNNRVQKFDSTGKFLSKFSDLGQYGILSQPSSVRIDADGYLWISDYGNSRTVKMDTSGTVIGVYAANTGLYPMGEPDGLGNTYVLGSYNYAGGLVNKYDANHKLVAQFGTLRQGALFFPWNVAASTDGTVYVPNRYTWIIDRFDSSGNYLGQLDISSNGLVVDAQGTLFITNTNGVYKYSPSGQLITRLGYPSITAAEDIAVSGNGDVYVATGGTPEIYRLNSTGSVLNSWGTSGGTGPGQFDWLNGIAVDSAGNLYACDSYNNRIQKFDSSGNFLTSWGPGTLAYPWGACVSYSGKVIVADPGPDKVQIYDTSGTLLGGWGGDGISSGKFWVVLDVAVDGKDNIYAVDQGNQRICKFAAFQTSLSGVKALKDGDFVALTDQVVTAGYGDVGGCFYVESLDRSSGIRVTGTGVSRPYKATIIGTMTTVDGERTIKAVSVTTSGTASLTPLAMTNKSLGGADLNYDPATGSGQMGVEDGQGANNIGLLVKTTGRVTGMGSDFVYIDDGTHARDGSIFVGVRVFTRRFSKPAVGSQVTVTGISRISKVGDRYFRAISPRMQADIVVAP